MAPHGVVLRAGVESRTCSEREETSRLVLNLQSLMSGWKRRTRGFYSPFPTRWGPWCLCVASRHAACPPQPGQMQQGGL